MNGIVNKFQNPSSPLQNYKDSYIGKLYYKDKPLSPIDPIGEFVVSGEILGKPLYWIGKSFVKPLLKYTRKGLSKLIPRKTTKQNIYTNSNDLNQIFILRQKNNGNFDKIKDIEIINDPKIATTKYLGDNIRDWFWYDVYNNIKQSGGAPFVDANTGKKFIYSSQIDNIPEIITRNHELSHILDSKMPRKLIRREVFQDPINNNYFINNYNTEIAARGSQLKDYFGITDQTPLTTQQLKYASQNYIKDTEVNNDMDRFFKGIKDYDELSKWISKYSPTILPFIVNDNANKQPNLQTRRKH